MKKFGLTLLTAFVGGTLAIGAYKMMETRYNDNLSFEDKQKVYFTSNPLTTNITSSAGEVDFTQAAAAVTPAVVYIRTTYAASRGGSADMDMFEQLFGQRFRGQRQQQDQRAPQASGSGVIISPDGYIVTNNHVVDKAEKIQVTTNDHRILEAKVIGKDPNTDLALIKVSASNLPIVKLGNSDDVRVGEWVLAVGNPFNLTSTVTAGIVSAKGRGIGIIGSNQDEDDDNPNPFTPSRNVTRQSTARPIESFIQTDAAINPGNSGGALVNTKGELIGINSAIASHTGSYEGYGFAIPVNLAKKVLNDIKQYGTVKRGLVGIQYGDLSDPDVAAHYKTDKNVGLYVSDVVKGGGAEAAGIKPGDIITKVDGNVVSESSDLTEHVGRLQPGDKVKLTALRGNEEKTFTVTLKADEGANTTLASNNSSADMLKRVGATFRPLTEAEKDKHNFRTGVMVTGVTRGGMFEDAGIVAGSIITRINRIPVNSVDDVNKALETSKKQGILLLSGINPDGSSIQ